MKINELTHHLLDAGYNEKDQPPGTQGAYRPWEGGWTYSREARASLVFETPCGLLKAGHQFLGGYFSFNGVDWRLENNNPVVCCPKFDLEVCPLRHELLPPPQFDGVKQCACHLTDRPYTYEESVQKSHNDVWEESNLIWETFSADHHGRVCQEQSSYNRRTKTWTFHYDPLYCTRRPGSCSRCVVLDKELSPKKGNVFYDVKKAWIQKGVGLFEDEQKSSIEKGIKFLSKAVSLTICEEAAKRCGKEILFLAESRNHRDMFFDPTLKIEVLNIRAARGDTRDILQDLKDVANGVTVTHAADNLKAAQEQKKANKAALAEQKRRKAETLIRKKGYEALEQNERHRVAKLLKPHEIWALNREFQQSQNPLSPSQISLF